jgi:hypothetical protein
VSIVAHCFAPSPPEWSQPEPEDVAFTVEVHADRHVDGPVRDLRASDLDDDRVDQHHGVDRVEGPVLPGDLVVDDRVGDLRDRLPGDVGVVDLREVPLNVTGRHALRVERDDVAGQPIEAALMLGDRDRFERSGAVAGHQDLDLADLGRDRLRIGAVTGVARPSTLNSVTFVAQVFGELDLESSLQHVAHQIGQ